MNAERLLQLYNRVSEAPDAIPRLRRFILDLAVRGKLVGACGRWQKATLGDLGTWGSGGTPLKSHPEYYGGDIPWLVIGDLNDGVVTSSQTRITQVGLENSSAKIIEPGTLLIAMYGSIGKLGLAGIRCATNQAIAFCVPDSSLVTQRYLFLLLSSLRERLLQEGQGVAQQNISQKILKAHEVLLPSLEDQDSIVAKADELMALCDSLEAEREKREATRDRLTKASLTHLTASDVDEGQFKAHAEFAIKVLAELSTRPDQIKLLRHMILDLAARGRLVEQDPNDESVAHLCKRISVERGQGCIARKGRKSIAGVKGNHKLPVIPSSWQWLPLGDLGCTQTGATPPKSHPEYYGDQIPFLRPGHLFETYVDYSGGGLSSAGIEASGHVAQPGSVLMVCIGTIGKCQILDRSAAFNQQINSLTAYADANPRFLLYMMRAPYFQNAAWNSSARTTIAILNKGNWETLPIPMPPLAEQHRIVAKVDELLALCNNLEECLTGSQETQARFGHALLTAILGQTV